VEEDASIVMSPEEHLKIVRISGMFSLSSSADPFFTPKAWRNSLVCSGRSAFNTHIKASIPSADLPSFCPLIRSRVASYASLKCWPLAIFNFRLLSEIVTSPRMALIFSETRRNLKAMGSQYKIIHGMGTVDVPTHIFETLSGIILTISARHQKLP